MSILITEVPTTLGALLDIKDTVNLVKKKHLLKLLTKLKKRNSWHINSLDSDSEEGCHITADNKSYATINRFISWRGKTRFVMGIFTGIITGMLLSYFIIPSGITYLYSSDKGLLPPQYDALFKGKPDHEKVMQILTHESQGNREKRGGPHGGKQMLFKAQVNDSAHIELWYLLAKKSIVVNIGQRKGEKIIKSQVEKAMATTGVDSAAKYYAGVEDANVGKAVGDAVSRTTAMQVEQGYLTQPVIRVVIGRGRKATTYTNFLPFEGNNDALFVTSDSDSTAIATHDHVQLRRSKRVITTEDEAIYQAVVQEFLTQFEDNKSIH